MFFASDRRNFVNGSSINKHFPYLRLIFQKKKQSLENPMVSLTANILVCSFVVHMILSQLLEKKKHHFGIYFYLKI